MNTHLIPGARLRKLTASAALGASALALAAGAQPADAAVGAGKSITVGVGSQFMTFADAAGASGGFPDHTSVRVVRNGVAIGRADNGVNGGEGITFNHLGDNCFEGDISPDVVAGDTIEAVSPNGTVDSMVVRDVTISDDVVVTPDGNTMTATGTISDAAFAEGGDLAFESQFGARPTRRFADSVNVSADDPASPNRTWTASVDVEDLDVSARAMTLMYTVGNETTLADGPEPDPACPPFALTGVGAVSHRAVNQSNQASPVVLSGPAAAGITGVTARIGATVVGTATPANGVWSIDVATASLAPGDNDIVVSFTGGGDSNPIRVSKDVEGPINTLSTNPAPGTYQSAQSVSITGVQVGATQIRYTTDGTDPTLTSPLYNGAINVPSSRTIKAILIDSAGNASTVKSFAFTIEAPVQQNNQDQNQNTNQTQTQTQVQQPSAPQPQPQPQVVTPQPQTAPSVSVATARSLRVTGSRSLRTVRRNGLRYSVRVTDGTRFLLVRLVRVKGSKRTVVQERVVRVTRAGLKTGTLRLPARTRAGRYQLEVAPAGADERYSSPIRTGVRIG